MCAATARTCACVSVCVWDGGDSRWDRMFQMIVFNHPHQSYERIKLYLCVSCLCACVCVCVVMNYKVRAVCSQHQCASFLFLHAACYEILRAAETADSFLSFHLLSCSISAFCGISKQTGAMLSQIQRPFFFWRCMNGRGDGRTPWWRPSLPGQPACLAI